MTHYGIWPAALIMTFLLSSCIDASVELGSGLTINHQSINLCKKAPGETFTWENLQLTNTGPGDLIIADITLRGNANCAFEALREAADEEPADTLYPVAPEEETSTGFIMTVPVGQTRVIRVDFTPSGAGVTDEAALVITTDATNLPPTEAVWKTLVIPICGTGLEAGETEPEADAGPDASVDSGAEAPPICEPCGATPEKGAPGCEA
jgi:hypothetical protein